MTMDIGIEYRDKLGSCTHFAVSEVTIMVKRFYPYGNLIH